MNAVICSETPARASHASGSFLLNLHCRYMSPSTNVSSTSPLTPILSLPLRTPRSAHSLLTQHLTRSHEPDKVPESVFD